MTQPVVKRSIQNSDIPFTKMRTPHGTVGYLFDRSYDSFEHDVDGQDYFVFQDGEDYFRFVVCDGVGQSYCGQIAARLLGERIFTWLESFIEDLSSDVDLSGQLTSYINDFCEEAQNIVLQDPLPDTLPDLLLRALHKQKEYGSEAVFVAGRINFYKNAPPQLNIFWLGDTQIHLFDKDGNEIDFPGKWINSERWSTKHGVRGTKVVNYWSGNPRNIKRIVVHSDGIKPEVLERLFILVDNVHEMRLVVDNLRSLPTSDDVSLISFDFPSPRLNLFMFFKTFMSLLINKIKIVFYRLRG